MKVLIDTNVILDYVFERRPFVEHSAEIIKAAIQGGIQGYISASAITDIYYILRKHKDHSFAKNFITDLINFLEIASVNRQILFSALKSDFTDIEDAVQNSVAEHENLDGTITRNTGDYKLSKLLVLSPDQFFTKYLKKKGQ